MEEISGKNLRGKAFRFGIFWNPIPATLGCYRSPWSATEICRKPGGGSRHCRCGRSIPV